MTKTIQIGFNITHSPNKESIAKTGDTITIKAKGTGYLITSLNGKELINANISRQWIETRTN